MFAPARRHALLQPWTTPLRAAVAPSVPSMLEKTVTTISTIPGEKMRQRSDYPVFSDQEMARRHQTINELMTQGQVDALLIYGSGRYSSDVYWATDWPCSREAYVLFALGKDPVVLLQLFNHFPMAQVMSVVKDVRWAGANTANSI